MGKINKLSFLVIFILLSNINIINAQSNTFSRNNTGSLLPAQTDWLEEKFVISGNHPQIIYIPDEGLFHLFYYSSKINEIPGLYQISSPDLIKWNERILVIQSTTPIDFNSYGVKSFKNISGDVDGVISYNEGMFNIIQTLDVEISSNELIANSTGKKLPNANGADIFIAPNIHPIDSGDYIYSAYLAYLDTTIDDKNPRLVYRAVNGNTGSNVGEGTTVATSSFTGHPSITYNDGLWHAMFVESGSLNMVSSENGINWNLNYFSSLFQPLQYVLTYGNIVAILKNNNFDLYATEFVSQTKWGEPILISPDNNLRKDDSQIISMGLDSWLLIYSDSGNIYIQTTKNFVIPTTYYSEPTTSISSQFTLQDDPVDEPKPLSRYSYNFFIVLLIIAFLLVGVYGCTRKSNKIVHVDHITTKNSSSFTSPMNNINNTMAKSADKVPRIFIQEINRKVRSCCYQTARLQEKYCWCGRAVPDDLYGLFK